MPVTIPTTRQPALTTEPRNSLFYGPTKTGKTASVSALTRSLHLDMDPTGGTAMIPARRVIIETPEELVEVVGRLKEEWQKAPWDFLIVDTIDTLDDWSDPIAQATFKKRPTGKNFSGSMRELEYGLGYYYMREELKNFLHKLVANQMWKTIFIGHIRDKAVEGKLDANVQTIDLDLTGKSKSIVCKMMDAIGYMFRDANGQLNLSFKTKDQLLCGCRCPHLAGKSFIFNTPTPQENWLAIYPDTVSKALQPPPAANQPPQPQSP